MNDLADMNHNAGRGGAWTLLTGHGHVLVEIARNPRARIRDIAPVVGLTERTVQAIVADLDAAGYLTRTRIGRRTHYTVNPDSPFRHSAQDGLRIGPFLDQLTAMVDVDVTEQARSAAGNATARAQDAKDTVTEHARPSSP
jgi:DNA-binding Lrp family transcriptional regulator